LCVFFKNQRNRFRRILQVPIHANHRVA
jgi:hypothetical protein